MPSMFGSWLNRIPKEYKTLLLLARQPCVGLFGYAEMLWYSITKNLFFAGYLLNYALAPYVGYPSEAYFTGQACSGISFLGTGGQGSFCPGTWVAV